MDEANAIDGVIAIFGWDEMEQGMPVPLSLVHVSGPDDGAMRIPPFTPLADGFVRYCGEPILGIVAIDKASAELALEAVNILFETSVAVIDVANALSNGAACVWDNYPDNRCFHFEKGDSNKVKKGKRKRSARYQTSVDYFSGDCRRIGTARDPCNL